MLPNNILISFKMILQVIYPPEMRPNLSKELMPTLLDEKQFNCVHMLNIQ